MPLLYTPVSLWDAVCARGSCHEGCMLQYYEKLSPATAPQSSAPPSADIAAALASEVAELKQQDGKTFAYHSTGVSGLAYITMRADAGNPLSWHGPALPSPCSCCFHMKG